ncbi:hypothetical protein [Variovorax atrisoli]|uniref:hypothetical protein n=1 Tax=Variovorax atrisoli TaxID=3394203 RepID=UPI00339414D9
MTFTVGFSAVWLREWANYLPAQQTAVAGFLAIYKAHGLSDQTRYPGRIGNSWHGLPINDPQYVHAQNNHLYHYHIGYPRYAGGQLGPPAWGQTSEDLLHFQWIGNHIKLVELSAHQVMGKFYIPTSQSLADPLPSPPPIADGIAADPGT